MGERSGAAEAPQSPWKPELTRGAFAIAWWNAIADLPERPWDREQPADEDGDGIVDHEDPLPLSRQPNSWPHLSEAGAP